MIKIIDLREEPLVFLSSCLENDEMIYKLHFENHSVILSEEQMGRIRG